MRDALDLIKKIGATQKALIKKDFLSPVFHNTQVVTRIEGLIHKLSIPETAPGWYKIRAKDYKTAVIKGPADLMDIEKYLNQLQKIYMILLYREKDFYLAIPFKNNNIGLAINNPVPVFLVTDQSNPFDTAICRFDGANFWYQENDLKNDPAKVEYLRECFEKYSNPDTIKFRGLSLEEKLAYSLRYNLDKRHRELSKSERLKKDVEHAGGKFVKFTERSDHYSVTYKVDSQEYTSYISKDPAHHVLTAGICLAGHDADYDLASLVTVLREGQKKRRIHRFHNTRA